MKDETMGQEDAAQDAEACAEALESLDQIALAEIAFDDSSVDVRDEPEIEVQPDDKDAEDDGAAPTEDEAGHEESGCKADDQPESDTSEETILLDNLPAEDSLTRELPGLGSAPAVDETIAMGDIPLPSVPSAHEAEARHRKISPKRRNLMVAGVVAGAVISGAYFGNGFSPVSDAPLMQSSVLGIDIWDHIKFMAPTTGIAWLISAVLYGILGARYAGTSVDLASVNDMLASLESLFHINVVTLIPMAVVLVMMIMRYSALMSILCGSVVGIFVAVFMQGFSVAEVTGFMKSGFSVTCDNALISSLLNRGGFTSMYELVAIIVGSLGIGGILKGTGVLNVIIESLSKHIKSLAGLTITTFVASVITNAMVGTYYFCMTFVGTLMPELYKKQGYKPENPGRIINNVANCLVVFLPWNIGAQYMSSQTGVAIKDFAPFAFFPILIMLVDLIFGIFGIGAAKYTPEEMAQFAAEEAAVKAE